MYVTLLSAWRIFDFRKHCPNRGGLLQRKFVAALPLFQFTSKFITDGFKLAGIFCISYAKIVLIVTLLEIIPSGGKRMHGHSFQDNFYLFICYQSISKSKREKSYTLLKRLSLHISFLTCFWLPLRKQNMIL